MDFAISLLKMTVWILISAAFTLPSVASAQKTSARHPDKPRPKIGLVLQGGGARGFAHVGVIRVLEELQIPVDMIAGTSMGALVGAAYACGTPVEEMEKALSETDWDALFDESSPREELPFRMKPGRNREIYGGAKLGIKNGSIATPSALIEGQKVLPLLQRLYENASTTIDFDQLPIPFRAVAADIETGETVVLDQGNLALAARASMSVPGFFSPVEIGGRLLVDGGITDNLPVDVVLEMGADILIVVTLPNELKKRDQLKDPLSISGQILTFLLDQNSKASLKLLRPQDILVDVDLKDYGAMDFALGRKIMEQGEVAARKVEEQLKSLSVSPQSYQSFAQHRLESLKPPERIEFVRIEDTSERLSPIIESSLSFKQGDPFDRTIIEKDIEKLFRSGSFKEIIYDVRKEDDKLGVVIQAKHKDWFQNFLRFGISLEDNFEGDSSYSLGVNWRKNWINSYGAHLDVEGEVGRAPRLFAEFYQPLAPSSRFFIGPHFETGKQKVRLRQNGSTVAEYTRSKRFIGLELGYEIAQAGEATVAYRFGKGDFDRDVGDPTLSSGDYDIGDLLADLTLDTLDSPDFPTRGYRLQASGLLGRDALGSETDFEQALGGVSIPFTRGETTLYLGLESGISSKDIPPARLYAFGGFLDISGFRAGDLLATDYFITRGVFYHQLSSLGSKLFNLGFFIGGSAEYANLTSSLEGLSDTRGIVGGSGFVGIDTPIAPLYLGFGLSDQGEHSFYLSLGRISASRRK